MAKRTIFERSPLGAFLRSPLGARVCRSIDVLRIITVPLYLEDGLTYEVTGEVFGATQGTGSLEIANTPFFDDVVVAQTVTAWADTSIVFDYVASGLAEYDVLWIKVTSNSSQHDQAITQAASIVGIITSGNANGVTVGQSGLVVAGVIPDTCPALFYPLYCGPVFAIQLGDEYGTGDAFINDCPGFVITGVYSGKVVSFGSSAFVTSASNNRTIWTSTSEALGAQAEGSTMNGNFTLRLPYFFHSCVADVGGTITCSSDPGGWDYTSPGPGEDVVLTLAHPVSLGITLPVPIAGIDVGTFPPWYSIPFASFAFAEDGDISTDVDWQSSVDGAIGSGQSFSTALSNGAHLITASVTSSFGQYRRKTIALTVLPIDAVEVFPAVGNSSGGQRITIYGSSFTSGIAVDVGGSAATGVTLINTNSLQCTAPAGTGLVSITLNDGTDSFELTDCFTYGSAANLSISGISPDSDLAAGGASVTITGTGFTSDCIVQLSLHDEVAVPATDIVFVSSTEITCTIPEWIDALGDVDVIVMDEVTGAGDILISGFTYT